MSLVITVSKVDDSTYRVTTCDQHDAESKCDVKVVEPVHVDGMTEYVALNVSHESLGQAIGTIIEQTIDSKTLLENC